MKGAWFLRFQHAWENIIVAEMLLGSCSSWRWCCQHHRLALRCHGIIWERCCSMLLLASFCTAVCKLCMVYTLSPLAFRPASGKSSSLSSINLSPMLWPSLLICPGHPNKNEATLCLSHMRLFWERNFKVAAGHTQLENSHLFGQAFCLNIRAVKLTV